MTSLSNTGFKLIFYDTQRIDGRSSIPFFVDTDNNEESISSNSESQAVKWLFEKNSKNMNEFVKCFFINTRHVKPHFELKEPFTVRNQMPGDIDLLFVNYERPDQSVAFECKRIKAYAINNETEKINGINKIRRGITQANAYLDLGFHQSYLMIIYLEDARNVHATNVFQRSVINDDHIYIPGLENLDENIGIVVIKIIQTTGNSIDHTGTLAFRIYRPAKPVTQEVSVTNKIKELINY